MTNQAFGLFNQWKLIRDQTRKSGNTLLRLLLQQEGVKTSKMSPWSLPGAGLGGGWRASSLNKVKVGVDWWVGPEGQLRWSAHPLSGTVCRCVYTQHPVLLPAPQLDFGLFISFVSLIWPNCACRQLLLVPYSFFVFYCSRRRLSRSKHCSKGFQVPACLRTPQCLLKLCLYFYLNSAASCLQLWLLTWSSGQVGW